MTMATSFISFPSIFLFRYSGVLPTMSPQIKTARITYITMFIRPTPLPPNTQFNIMWSSGTRPPNGVRESCMLLTVPVVNEVVTVVKRADCSMPKRVSFPSMLPISWLSPMAPTTGFPALSALKQTARPIRKIMAIAPKITAPCLPNRGFFPSFLSWSISPKVTTQDPGRSIMEIISTILEITVGFSNGVDELAPKKPPPLVPRCLMDSRAATGPTAIS